MDSHVCIRRYLGNYTVRWLTVSCIYRGFGNRMANSAMVIMWPNSNGSITISQRTAPGHVMPTVDTNPPRVATVSTSLSSVRFPDLTTLPQCLSMLSPGLRDATPVGFYYPSTWFIPFLYPSMFIICEGQLRYATKCHMGFRNDAAKFIRIRCHPPATSRLWNLST